MLTSIEQAGDHANTTILNFCGLGILFIIDEVFGEGFDHQFLRFFFLSEKVNRVASAGMTSPTMYVVTKLARLLRMSINILLVVDSHVLQHRVAIQA
jgi:hypothetical protein